MHLLAGLGVEYATRRGLALRAEGIAFDADVNYLQLGLLYRFGRGQRERIESMAVYGTAPAPVASAPAPVAVPAPAAALPLAAPDTDADGVSDPTDDCPATPARAAVDERGCALLSGTIEGLVFASGSARLTPSARAKLDEVAETLRQFPAQRFLLSAHTDGQGPAEANLALSKRRAASVASYLIGSGIAAERFEVRAFGESRPIASNDTPEGRQVNRRVDLVVVR